MGERRSGPGGGPERLGVHGGGHERRRGAPPLPNQRQRGQERAGQNRARMHRLRRRIQRGRRQASRALQTPQSIRLRTVPAMDRAEVRRQPRPRLQTPEPQVHGRGTAAAADDTAPEEAGHRGDGAAGGGTNLRASTPARERDEKSVRHRAVQRRDGGGPERGGTRAKRSGEAKERPRAARGQGRPGAQTGQEDDR